MVPIRGCSRGSTTRVREVPIASGWPGQSSANALWLARPAINARQMAVDRPARNPTEPLLIRTHRLTDHDAPPAFLTHARWRHLSRRPKFVSQFAAMVHPHAPSFKNWLRRATSILCQQPTRRQISRPSFSAAFLKNDLPRFGRLHWAL